MSLLQIQTFIKNNNHDILDYYIEDQYIKFLKVISRKTGHIFFINVYNYNIPFENNIDMNKYNFYFIDHQSQDDDFINNLYQDFINLFPELYSKFLLLYGCHIYIDSENIYHIKNLSISTDLSLFLYFDIEMFYENIYVIAHEVEKLYNNIHYKINKQYEQLLLQFLGNNELKKKIEDYRMTIHNYFNRYQKVIHLYLKMCFFEEKYNELIKNLENEKSDEYMKSVLFKSHKKKNILDKLNQFQILYIKIYDNLSHSHFLYWKYNLKLLFFISNLIKYFSSIKNIYLEINDLLNI